MANKLITQLTATELYQSRILGKPILKLSHPISTIQQGYEIQHQLFHMIQGKKNNTCTRFFKIANTNQSSQSFLQLFEPFYGQVPSSHIHYYRKNQKHTINIDISKCNVRLIELEFAFRMGADGKIPDAIIPSIEIVHSSFVDWRSQSAPSLIADLACNFCFILGEPIPWNEHNNNISLPFPKFHVISTKHNSEITRTNGNPANVMGHPLNVLEWFIKQQQSNSNLPFLKSGDIVSTGVCSDPPYYYARSGDIITVNYGPTFGGEEMIFHIT
jgi:2-keto-4-pentenoate hydratase